MKVKKVLNKHSDPLVVQTYEGHKEVNDDQISSLPNPMTMNDEPPDRCSPVPSTSAIPHTQTSLSSLPSTSAAQPPVISCDMVPPLKDITVFTTDETMTAAHSPPPSLNDIIEFLRTPEPNRNHFDLRDIQPLDDRPTYLFNSQTNSVNQPNAVLNESNTNNCVQNSATNANMSFSLQNDSFDCSDTELQKLLEDFVEDGLPQLADLQYLQSEENILTQPVGQDVIEYNQPFIVPNAVNSVINTNTNAINVIPQSHTNINQSNHQSLAANDLNASIVSIDLSEDSNSPQTNQSPSPNFFPKVIPIAGNSLSKARRFEPRPREPPNEQLPNRTPHLMVINGGQHTVLSSSQAFRSQPKTKPVLYPFNYCAKDYRIFNLTRTSNRNKNGTQNEEFEYDILKNISWAECDGSQYEAKVKKWNEDEMDEDRRKEILRSVQDDDNKKFVKSAYESDKNVFYWWKAFKEESFVDRRQHRGELRCMMKLDTNAVKGQRFTKYETRLFILVGTVLVIVENGKQRKTVDVGHEVVIPPHTRFGLENRSPDECYLYCIISN